MESTTTVTLRGLYPDASSIVRRHGPTFILKRERLAKSSGRRRILVESQEETRRKRDGSRSRFVKWLEIGKDVEEAAPDVVNPVDAVMRMGFSCRGGRRELDLSLLRPAVYFLIKDSRVVYVGQSANLPARIGQHFDGKEFDRVVFFDVPRSHLDFVEGAFIRKLRPEMNGNRGMGWPVLDEEILKIYTAEIV